MNRDERPQRKERERLRSEEAGVRVQPGEAVRRVAIEKERREEARRNRSTRGEYDSVLPETFPLYAMDLEGEGTFEGCTGTGAGFEYIADTQVEADPVARLFGRCQSFEGGGEVHTMSGKGVTLDKKGREVLRGVGERSRKESGEAMRVAMDLQAEIGFTHAFATDGSKHRDGRMAYGIWTGARLREQGAHKEEGLRMLQTELGMEERATGRGMEGGRLSGHVGDSGRGNVCGIPSAAEGVPGNEKRGRRWGSGREEDPDHVRLPKCHQGDRERVERGRGAARVGTRQKETVEHCSRQSAEYGRTWGL